jgi:hypothetical protein
MNKSELTFDHNQNRHRPVVLVCKYGDIIVNPNEQIKWFFNKIRIKNNNNINDKSKHLLAVDNNQIFKTNVNSREEADLSSTTTTTHHPNSFNHYTIIQSISYERNESISTLIIHNFNIKHHAGRYKCQYKGLIKTVRLNPSFRSGE